MEQPQVRHSAAQVRVAWAQQQEQGRHECAGAEERHHEHEDHRGHELRHEGFAVRRRGRRRPEGGSDICARGVAGACHLDVDTKDREAAKVLAGTMAEAS